MLDFSQGFLAPRFSDCGSAPSWDAADIMNVNAVLYFYGHYFALVRRLNGHPQLLRVMQLRMVADSWNLSGAERTHSKVMVSVLSLWVSLYNHVALWGVASGTFRTFAGRLLLKYHLALHESSIGFSFGDLE